MSSTYRDERASLLSSLASLRRENEDLRAENLALRVLVDPPSARGAVAQLQGALTAVLIVAASLLGALLVTRDASTRAPRAAVDARESAVALLPTPALPEPPGASASEARIEPPAEPPAPSERSSVALRAALRPLEPALHACLRGVDGDLRVRVSIGADGSVRAAEVTPRAQTRAPAHALRCASSVAGRLRFDADGAVELRYTVRVSGGGLRVRRARRR